MTYYCDFSRSFIHPFCNHLAHILSIKVNPAHLPYTNKIKRENGNKLKRIKALLTTSYKTVLHVTIQAITLFLVALVFVAGYVLLCSYIKSSSEFSRYDMADVVFDGTVLSKERPKILSSIGEVIDDLSPTDLLVCDGNRSNF